MELRLSSASHDRSKPSWHHLGNNGAVISAIGAEYPLQPILIVECVPAAARERSNWALRCYEAEPDIRISRNEDGVRVDWPPANQSWRV